MLLLVAVCLLFVAYLFCSFPILIQHTSYFAKNNINRSIYK